MEFDSSMLPFIIIGFILFVVIIVLIVLVYRKLINIEKTKVEVNSPLDTTKYINEPQQQEEPGLMLEQRESDAEESEEEEEEEEKDYLKSNRGAE